VVSHPNDVLSSFRQKRDKISREALLERDGNRYAYRLTDKGVKVALLFVLFHQRLCGPLANSLFHHRPNANFQPDSKLEAAVHKADDSIRKIIELLEAT
jgi:hypothetical protein